MALVLDPAALFLVLIFALPELCTVGPSQVSRRGGALLPLPVLVVLVALVLTSAAPMSLVALMPGKGMTFPGAVGVWRKRSVGSRGLEEACGEGRGWTPSENKRERERAEERPQWRMCPRTQAA